MSVNGIVLIGLIAAVVFLYYDRFITNRPELPKLEPGERFIKARKNESNVTIARKGLKTYLVDEQENEIAFKETIK